MDDKNKKWVYISGPITNTANYVERFAEAEELLEKAGYFPVNPAKFNSALPVNASWEEYMETSLCVLKMCRRILFLPGYTESRGALWEEEEARKLGIKPVELAEELTEPVWEAWA